MNNNTIELNKITPFRDVYRKAKYDSWKLEKQFEQSAILKYKTLFLHMETAIVSFTEPFNFYQHLNYFPPLFCAYEENGDGLTTKFNLIPIPVDMDTQEEFDSTLISKNEMLTSYVYVTYDEGKDTEERIFVDSKISIEKLENELTGQIESKWYVTIFTDKVPTENDIITIEILQDGYFTSEVLKNEQNGRAITILSKLVTSEWFMKMQNNELDLTNLVKDKGFQTGSEANNQNMKQNRYLLIKSEALELMEIFKNVYNRNRGITNKYTNPK